MTDVVPWTLFSAHGRQREVDRCLVMAILNATPDSFSDGGQLAGLDVGAHATALVAAGADILDVGGESTRPGHREVPAQEEVARVVPVVRAVRTAVPEAWLSIDTSKGEVAAAAIEAGADFVNDVRALADPAMARLVARRACSVVLMRHDDCSGDIVASCRDQLRSLAVRARAGGIAQEQIILDPGLGFGARPGPSVEDNLALVDGVSAYALGLPVLIGASRKRFVAAWSGAKDLAQRDKASARLAVHARDAGAAIVRVHDVAGTMAALSKGP